MLLSLNEAWESIEMKVLISGNIEIVGSWRLGLEIGGVISKIMSVKDY